MQPCLQCLRDDGHIPSPSLVVALMGHVARVLLPLRFPTEETSTLFRRLLALVCWRDCFSCGVSLPLPGFPPASLGSTAPRVPSSQCSRCWTPRWFSRQVLSSFAFLVQFAGCGPSSRLTSSRLWRGLLHPAQVFAAHTRACQDRSLPRQAPEAFAPSDGRYRCGTASSLRSDITGSCPGRFPVAALMAAADL